MTNDRPEPTSKDEWRDRLVDRALDELVGGQTPPDLSEPLVAAHAASGSDVATLSSSGERAMATEKSPRATRFRTWALAASLLLNLGLGAWLIADRESGEPVVALVDQSASLHQEQRAGADAENVPPAPAPVIQSEQLGDLMQPAGQSEPRLAESRRSNEGVINYAHSPGGGRTNRNRKQLAQAPQPPRVERFTRQSVLKERIVAPQDEVRLGYIVPSDEAGEQGQGQNGVFFGSGGGGFGGGGSWGFQGPEPRPYLKERWHGDPEGRGIGPGAAGDQYDRIVENPFKLALGEQAISTFSIDVDTASYANVRQMLQSDVYPPADAVRLEEFVNYFIYDGKYADFATDLPDGGTPDEQPPFAAQVEVTGCPWEPKHRLVKVGVFGREIEASKRPKSNLVFLVDVSGSMDSPEKLPLVIEGMQQLAKELGENDKVAIVVYASSEGLVLPSTPGDQQEKILAALESLSAGGSTAGGAGITLAYQIAQENFIEGGTNRVILCTDGDFNVGTTSTAELERMVEQKAKETKVFLSVIGFGRGNLNDAMMEKITGIGNGNYYYVDGQREAERVFVKGMTGMLVTIAKDVKIQIEFNPNKVAGYRLLGYENRMLRTEDFNDDTKDAGEIGAGHRVTALYEIVPAGEPVTVTETDDFKYQRPPGLTPEAETEEMLTLKMRYKAPASDTSQKLEWTAIDPGKEYGQASTDTRFAAAVAGFGMLLRDSQYKGNLTFDAVHELASAAVGSDPDGERSEFLTLVEAAKGLKGEIDAAKKAEEEAATPQPPVAEPTISNEPKMQDATPVAPK